MEYKDTNAWVNKARTVDEKYVIEVLQRNGIKAEQGTVIEDWQHIDLHTDIGDIDVKRNHKSQYDSPNFTFTYINNKLQEFPYRADAYLAYIDDKTEEVYIVNQMIMKNLVEHSYTMPSKFGKGRYAIISKSKIRKSSEKILK